MGVRTNELHLDSPPLLPLVTQSSSAFLSPPACLPACREGALLSAPWPWDRLITVVSASKCAERESCDGPELLVEFQVVLTNPNPTHHWEPC